MVRKHKPLQPYEVPNDWHKYIFWDEERKYVSGQGFHIRVVCPQCNKLHWTKESCLRTRHYQSLCCRGCNARKELTPDEVPEHWKSIILWDKERSRTTDGKWGIWVECPKCKSQRLFSEARLRMGDVGSGMCRSCVASRSGPNHNSWVGGRRINKAGYVDVNIYGYSDWELEIAKQMCNGKGVIREHRLVMALHLGRPLTKDEIVHHKDGNRINNAIENLELLTKKKHHKGHGDSYYQKWQESVSRIKELEAIIEDLKNGS